MSTAASVRIGGDPYRIEIVGADSYPNFLSLESLNDSGTMVGEGAGIDPMGVLIDAKGSEPIPGLALTAYGISNNGWIVGLGSDCFSGGLPIATHSYLWDRRTGERQRLRAPGSAITRVLGCERDSTIVYDVSVLGIAVGEFTDASGTRRGFSGPVDDLHAVEPPLGAGVTASGLRAINQAGDLAGEAVDAGGARHAIVIRDGNWRRIEVPGALWSEARDISDTGVVVGSFGDVLGKVRGFVWRNARLDVVEIAGALETRLNGLNRAGTMVGAVRIAEPPGQTGSRQRGLVLSPVDSASATSAGEEPL
ncbi:MAG: hypothetical protein H6934_10845 [Burkholderiaceae bacterium]|nr:hypothetical protein [Burkholderiaceae bacterium]